MKMRRPRELSLRISDSNEFRINLILGEELPFNSIILI